MKSLSSRAAIVLSPAERRAVSSKSKSEKAEKRRRDVLAKAEKRANALSKKLGRSVAILGTRGRAVHESRAGAPHTKQVALPRSKKKNPATEVVCVATKPNPGRPSASRQRKPMSGYVPCKCRDCMDPAIASDVKKGAFCNECAAAGCETDAECRRDDAYGG